MTTKTINLNLPSISIDGGLSNYLTQIKKFPMLSPEEEYMLAKRWKKRGDIKSAQKLITSHLRLVAKIAMGYKGYGLPVNEMISEGNIGLMQAVKKFEPEKGFKEKSLNDPVKDESGTQWQDWLVDNNIDQELALSKKQEFTQRKNLMNDAMNILNDRERKILIARKLSDESSTLEDLSKKYKVSRERIRQIETKAFEKLKKAILTAGIPNNLLPNNLFIF